MLKDIPENIVEGVYVAIVQETGNLGDLVWNAYVVNRNDYPLDTVLIMSFGHGTIDGEKRKTSILRKMIDSVGPKSAALVEPVDPVTFGLYTEFSITYYKGRLIHDAQFIFAPNKVTEENLTFIPEVDKKGVIVS